MGASLLLSMGVGQGVVVLLLVLSPKLHWSYSQHYSKQ